MNRFLLICCCALLLMSCDRNSSRIETLGHKLLAIQLPDYNEGPWLDSATFASKLPELQNMDMALYKSLSLLPNWKEAPTTVETEFSKTLPNGHPVYNIVLRSNGHTTADCALQLTIEIIDEQHYRILDHTNCSGCG